MHDEAPLRVLVGADGRVTAIGTPEAAPSPWVTAGVYWFGEGVAERVAEARASGILRLRHFLSRLVEAGLDVRAHDLGRVVDVDTADDLALLAASGPGGPMTLSIVALRRARLFSPGHVSHDWLILKETADRLAALGHDVRFLEEETVGATPPPADLVLNMCQGPEANGRLCAAEGDGVAARQPPERRARLPALPPAAEAAAGRRPDPRVRLSSARRTPCPPARGPRPG